MIDHLLGRPSNEWKRSQVIFVLLFWTVALVRGNKNGPPIVRWFSRRVRDKLTPWQVLAATLSCLYAVKNADAILGLQAPEPLARLYSSDFYRATWMVTALDTGFATAMHIRPNWLRHIVSVLFSGYYLLFANEADDKLRKYRAFCTVEMLRATWEKTTNPLLRAATVLNRPRLAIKRSITLPRPKGSPYNKPVQAILYYAGTEQQLADCHELILDIPGGGFVCMGPEHHDERIHYWAKKTAKPVLSLKYSKAPEYPYPYAMHECFDVYRLLHETKGSVLGMLKGKLSVVLSGDSAGANLGAALMIKVLEVPGSSRLPLPLSIIWAYPALDFNFTSFMPPEHLKILRQESSSTVRGIAEQKDHLKHHSPLAVVEDNRPKHRRKLSWTKSFNKLPLIQSLKSPGSTPSSPVKRLPATAPMLHHAADGSPKGSGIAGMSGSHTQQAIIDKGDDADSESDETCDEAQKALSERVQYWNPDRNYAELGDDITDSRNNKKSRASTLGTRLTMTSRTGFFNDRIISPSMMRAMAICYVGPRNSPDLSKNYYISPILTPSELLAQFPPVYLLCGERDPFSDDTLIFSGRLRDAKLARKAEAQNKRSKFGEGLRMSSSSRTKEDPILEETEEDWVTTRFIEGWSHGFMQMLTLLPKVERFFALTADWASYSFARNDVSIRQEPIPSHSLPVAIQAPGQESASESEGDVLSFVPRRRGSRTSSPVPPKGLRSDLQQQGALHSSSSPLSSSASETNCSTGPTSVTSGEGSALTQAKLRRPSPSDQHQRLGPVQRVLQDEVDTLRLGEKGHRIVRSLSDPLREVEETSTLAARRGSDALDNAVAAATFVGAQDLLKRRREDAVRNLGSALLSDDSEEDRAARPQ